MENVELILTIIIGAFVVIGSIVYYSSSDLNSCYVCGKPFSSMKQNRYWWEFDGKKRPVCTKCDKKLEESG
ncbi:hypothetical protein CWC33_11890 [Idiomarina sp. X4]|nr:hypothetical protein CWC33_11890 [Idiomarina sp. X4]